MSDIDSPAPDFENLEPAANRRETSRDRKEAARVAKLGRVKVPERRVAGTHVPISTTERYDFVHVDHLEDALFDLADASIDKNHR